MFLNTAPVKIDSIKVESADISKWAALHCDRWINEEQKKRYLKRSKGLVRALLRSPTESEALGATDSGLHQSRTHSPEHSLTRSRRVLH